MLCKYDRYSGMINGVNVVYLYYDKFHVCVCVLCVLVNYTRFSVPDSRPADFWFKLIMVQNVCLLLPVLVVLL